MGIIYNKVNKERLTKGYAIQDLINMIHDKIKNNNSPSLSDEEMKKYVKKFASKKNLTVIEDTNMQLMKSELEERESSRDDNGF